MRNIIKRSFLLMALLASIGLTACSESETAAEANNTEAPQSNEAVVTEAAPEEQEATTETAPATEEMAQDGMSIAPMAYVPNEKDGTISVIDTATDTVVGLLPKDGKLGEKIQAVALHPDGKNLYVVVRDKNAVAFVDLATGMQTAIVEVGDEPEGIDVSPDGTTLVACLEEENAVSFVDIATTKLMHTVKTQGTNPEHCGYSKGGEWVLASNEESGDVDVISVEKHESVHLIGNMKHPRGIGFTPCLYC